ncbi:YaaR family protein [Bacillaceae bacterium SIJ1]|uniref:YaaR family protein n=1 Tax=Litoribacterium kuwaitense TaxID=1398745 RepID=UPI0013EAFD55|nr:YaaR family protein [Litoribacterium kuwaitense]NGP44931.1 YaaR family protein [Litoribacterium kuwaitense]
MVDVRRIQSTELKAASAPKKSTPQSSMSFQEVIASGRIEKTREKLTGLMKDIDAQGKVLADSRSVEELRRYKALVKEFMQDAVDVGLQLQERRGFNRQGRTKIYKIVETVDAKLAELTSSVLEKEASSLQILDQIGEIKGLLLNIYT